CLPWGRYWAPREPALALPSRWAPAGFPRKARVLPWASVEPATAAPRSPLFTMIVFAKEPPDTEHQRLGQHLQCLFDRDGWYFNLIYIITSAGSSGSRPFYPRSLSRRSISARQRPGSSPCWRPCWGAQRA